MPHLEPDDLTRLALGESLDASGAGPHLLTCRECRTELDALSTTVRLARIGGSAPEAPMVAPPEAVWTAIRSELDLAPVQEPEVPSRVRWWRDAPARRRPRLLAAAAAVAFVAVGIGAALAVQSRRGPVVLDRAVLAQLADDPRTSGSVQVLRTGAGIELELRTQNLPTNDGYFEVWLIDPVTGGLVSLGVLADQGTGRYLLPSGLDLARYPVVDVSVEPYDGNPAHSSDSVLRGELRT